MHRAHVRDWLLVLSGAVLFTIALIVIAFLTLAALYVGLRILISVVPEA